MTKIKLKKKYQKLIINFMIAILSVVFIYSVYNMFKIIYFNNQSEKENKELIELVVHPKELDLNEKNQEDTNTANNELEIDFQKLLEINNEVVGWIEIPNTNINYPIVKHSNNSYYLNHNIYRKYNITGSIYMNYKNNASFTDNNTILFGHNTHKSTMFSDLKKIYEGKYGNDIKINIYTIDNKYEYKIYSAYIADPNDVLPLDISTQYFTKTDEQFIFDKTITKTLTLSTCLNDNSKRIIIHALLIESNV